MIMGRVRRRMALGIVANDEGHNEEEQRSSPPLRDRPLYQTVFVRLLTQFLRQIRNRRHLTYKRHGAEVGGWITVPTIGRTG